MTRPKNETSSEVGIYQVEPYVVAGDVYAFPPQAGRGGWTWYTGSAGWMSQRIVESLFGVQRSGNQLRVRPLIPKAWTTFEVRYSFGATVFSITCREAAEGAAADVVVDGIRTAGDSWTLIDDGHAHEVLVNVAHRR